MKNDLEIRQQVARMRGDHRNSHAMMHVGATYLLIAANLLFLKQNHSWPVCVASFFFIGFMQYRLVMSTHEAVHKTLFFPVPLNEFFGVFNAALMGISFHNYRKTHLEHHKNPQSIDDDIDGYIYRPLLRTKPGLPRLCLLVFGVLVDIAEKIKRKLIGVKRVKEDSSVQVARNPVSPFQQFWPIAVCQIGMISLFTFCLEWWMYPLLWVAPVMLVALSLDRARTFLEHGYVYIFGDQTWKSFSEAPQTTVDIRTNAFERFFFAPFGFTYHQAHHAYLTVPFYNLPQLASYLEEKDETYHRRVHGSYALILLKMIWASK